MKTEQLIQNLSLQPVKKSSPSFYRVLAEWFTVTLISLTAVTLLYGIRLDFQEQLSSTGFLSEATANIMLMLASGYSAVYLAYPNHLKKKLAISFMMIAGLYITIILARVYSLPADISESSHATHAHSINCALCVLSFAIIPAAFICWRLKQLASTHPALLGTLCILMAMSTGALGVLLVETELATTGLILWHYLPVLVFAIIGFAIGKKIFKW